jgi:outer membrane receptor protein involved in Fe transport
MEYKRSILLGALVSLMMMASSGGAQTIQATVRGKVVDQQGAVLPGATITARHVETNTLRTVVTEELGQFFLPNLPAGRYEITTALPGFATAQRTLELTVGSNFSVDFTLQVSGIAEAVSVTGEAPLIETTKTTIGQTINKAQVDMLPTVNRDFSGLAQLAPGVSAGVGGNGPTLAVNAQRGYQNNVFVDGASNQWQYYGRQASTFSQDWIQEFQVMTNSFAAEFGNASGGILNVITRSGANQFHGRGYFYYRDKALDSPPFAGFFDDNNIDDPVFLDKDEVPDYTQRRWGGYLGGPVVKNKVFFFTGYEDLNRESTDQAAIADYWKAQGFGTIIPVKNTDHPFIVKSDVNLNANNRLSIRYDRTAYETFNDSQYGAIAPEAGRDTFGGPVWNLVGNWTATLGNTSFNEFRGYFMSNKPPIICNASGQGGMGNFDLGPPGTYAHHRYPGLRTGCPIFHGLEGEENLGFIDNFSFVRGEHQFKLGGQMIQNRMTIDISNFHDGYWRFGQDRVFDRNDPSTYPFLFTGNAGPGAWKSPIWNYSLFAQDTWQIRDNLTLNLGIRYDVDRSVTAGNEFVDQKNRSIVETLGGTPKLEKTTVDYDNVSPRLGIVWTPADDKLTTVRGAFGFFYDQNHGNFNAIYIINTLISDGFATINCNLPGSNPFWNAANTASGIATCGSFLARSYPFFPDLSVAPAATQGLDALDPNLQVPRTTQVTGGVAREFAGGVVLAADLIHSRGSGLLYIEQNLRPLPDGQVELIDPRFSSFTPLYNRGYTHYTAMQLHAQYRKQDANFGVAYTLSKATSNLGSGSIYGSSPTNPFDLDQDKGPDATDQRHNFAFNGAYTFPYDFQLSGIFVLRSARPWSVFTSENPTGVAFPPRPESKNSRRGDDYKTLDFRVGRPFKLVGNVSATVFWEIFNTFNWANFFDYDGDLESSSFGFPLNADDMRRQQFGLRIDF